MIASEADIPLILDLCHEAHVGSVWEDVGADYIRGDAEIACRALMGGEDSEVFVSERGTLWLKRFPLWFNRAEIITREVFFFATKGSDALRREGERWAGSGLRVLARHDKTDPRLDTYYRRAGYRPIEHDFIRRA